MKITKVIGPYTQKNRRNRKCVKIFYDNGLVVYRTQARYTMEQHLGRELSKDEVVHHIDLDPTNDSFENLRLLSKEDHDNLHNPKHPTKHGTMTAWRLRGCKCQVCVDAKKLYFSTYNLEHQEDKHDYNVSYYQRNKEKIKAQTKEYRWRNIEKTREKDRLRYKERSSQ
jgi:hypothetical protein